MPIWLQMPLLEAKIALSTPKGGFMADGSTKGTLPVPKKESRKTQLAMTVSSNLIWQAVNMVCGFIAPALIVGRFGSAINGLLSSVGNFISWLNLLEAGVGGATIAALYTPLARRDFTKISGIVSAAKKFYFRSGVMFSSGIVIMAFVYPWIVRGQVAMLTSALLVLILGITGTSGFFLISKYSVLLIADKKQYIFTNLQALFTVVNRVAMIALIKLGFDIVTVRLTSSLLYVSRFAFLYWYVKKHYPQVDYGASPDTKEISQSRNVMVHQFSGFIIGNTPVALLTFLVDLKEVSVYSIYSMIFGYVNGMIGSFSVGIHAFFGESIQKDSRRKMLLFFRSYETLLYSVSFWFYTVGFILIMPFLSVYTTRMSDANYIRVDYALLFVINRILGQLRVPAAQMISAHGHFKKTQWRALTEMIINTVASIIFTWKFGVIGVLLGRTVSHIYRDFDMIFYNAHLLKTSVLPTFAKIAFFTACALGYAKLSVLVDLSSKSFIEWIIKAVVVALACSLPVLFVIARKAILLKAQRKGQH